MDTIYLTILRTFRSVRIAFRHATKRCMICGFCFTAALLATLIQANASSLSVDPLISEPLTYIPDQNARYIDFENGDDDNKGTRTDPWKHHPWDPNARGNAATATGIRTYIFRKGTIYRGFLDATQSGSPKNPVRLTIDPDWGEGEAILSGSQKVTEKWSRCNPEITSKLPAESVNKAWCLTVKSGAEPRMLWKLDASGITRIPLARTPNWKIIEQDDPRSQWYELTDVILELPLEVDGAKGFSIGDNLSVIPGRQAPAWQTESKKLPLIRIIDIDKNQLLVEVRNWHAGLLRAGNQLTNNKTRTTIKQPGGSHSIIRHLADTAHLKSNRADAYAGATIWAERRSMPKADAAIITNNSRYDHLLSANFHRSIGGGPRPHDRYYLEGLPEFLDSPGEYLYIPGKNNSGTLVLRLPNDDNPNLATIETALRPTILSIVDKTNIDISGLIFRFSNQVFPGTREARFAPLHASAIQIRGNSRDIRIHNCRFFHLPAGIVGYPEDRAEPSRIDNIFISDNTFNDIDGSAIAIGNGQMHHSLKKNGSRLVHVNVLRNRITNSGYRTLAHFSLGNQGHAIGITGGEVVDVTGNRIDRVWGAGISVRLGSGYKDGHVARPLLRGLIRDNRVIDSLLGLQDAGGITSWMGGPTYIYNNISGNPVGCMHSKHITSRRHDWYRRGCYGVGIYLDGQYKGYVFNNIAWGKNNNANDRIYNSAGFNEAMGFMNTIFHNTFSRFAVGLHKGIARQHNRNYYIGNLFLDMGLQNIQQENISSAIEPGTLAFSNNLFWGNPNAFGKFGNHRRDAHKDLSDWQGSMHDRQMIAYDTGVIADRIPVNNVNPPDFSPTKDSPAIDAGGKVFVPWALYGVVGEWHFLRRRDAPSVITGENINMNAEWHQRDMYHLIPRNDLQCRNTRERDFVAGILEDWVPGALKFDGERRYCVLADAIPESTLEQSPNSGHRKDSASDTQRETVDMGTNNFLIEVVLAPTPGSGQSGIVSKRGERGYELDLDSGGHLRLTLDSENGTVSRTSSVSIDDGNWHHVITEVDRSSPEGITIYIDGKRANGTWAGTHLHNVSLSNSADFEVGRSSAGAYSGLIDFLRISRGTLAQAETNIEELFDWEFNGPFLRDFYGRAITGKLRDVGAVEFSINQTSQ